MVPSGVIIHSRSLQSERQCRIILIWSITIIKSSSLMENQIGYTGNEEDQTRAA
jgi:hypothetical protein